MRAIAACAARALALGLLVGGVTASAAGAASESPELGELRGGPEIAGASVTWAVGINNGVTLRRAGQSPAPTTQLMAVARPSGEARARLAGTTDVLAADIATVDFDGSIGARELDQVFYAGPLSAPATKLLSCFPAAGAAGLQPSLDADADVVVYSAPACGAPERSSVHIRDVTADTEEVVDATARLVRVAGPYVAWLQQTSAPEARYDLVVYDRAQHAEVYRVPAAALPQEIISLDIQSDATVALAYISPNEGTFGARVGVVSRETPTVRQLPLPLRSRYDIRLAGDQIAFERSTARTTGRSLPEIELGTAGLDGIERVLRAPVVTVAPFPGSFDFDGSDAAWIEPRCRGVAVVRAPITSSALIRSTYPRCQLALRGRPAIRGRMMRARIWCSGFDLGPGCAGRIVASLRLPSGQRVSLGRGSVSRGGRARLGLHRATVRKLPRNRRLQVTLRVTRRNLLDSLYKSTAHSSLVIR